MSEEMSAVMPEWYDGKKINEVMFCDAFLEEFPMKCIREQFFTVDGLVDDENMIRMEIYNRIKPFVTSRHFFAHAAHPASNAQSSRYSV